MHVAVMTNDWNAAGLITRLQGEDHFVHTHLPPDLRATPGGLYDVRGSLADSIGWADLLLCDHAGFSKVEQRFRKSALTLGFSRFQDAMHFSMTDEAVLLESAGLPVQTVQQYDTRLEAKALHVRETQTVVVGDGQGTTRVAHGEAQFFWAIDSLPEGPVMVRNVRDGNLVHVTGWFQGTDWLPHVFLSVQEPGLSYGCLTYNRELIGALHALSPSLHSQSYRGPVTLSLVLRIDGTMEVLQCRADWNRHVIDPWLCNFMSGLGTFMVQLAHGMTPQYEVGSDFSICVDVLNRADPGAPIVFDPEAESKLIPRHVTWDEDAGSVWHCTAKDEIALTVCAHGRSINEAKRRAQRTIAGLRSPALWAPAIDADKVGKYFTWGNE